MVLRETTYHQRGETIMAQGVLPFQYQDQNRAAGLTALAGLPAYLDLAQAAGLRDTIFRHLKVCGDKTQGWSDHQIVMALILLNLAGGDCVADLDKLEADEGLCQVMRRVEHYGLPGVSVVFWSGAGAKNAAGRLHRLHRYFAICQHSTIQNKR